MSLDAVTGLFQIYEINVYFSVPLDTLLNDVSHLTIKKNWHKIFLNIILRLEKWKVKSDHRSLQRDSNP